LRVIVTGGTGLIGSALTRRLVDAGDEVIVLSRTPERHTVPAGTRYEGWDGRTEAGWGELVDGAGAIVNLAGASIADKRWNPERKALLRSSRVDAGHAVAQAIAAAPHPPSVVVQASAIGYYGPRGDEFVDESEPPGTDFPAQLCVDWEESSKAVTGSGVRHVVVRIGLVFTPRGGTLGRLLPLFRLGLGGRLGSGRQWMSWIHIDDVVGGLDYLVRHESAAGVFNIVSPNPVTNSQFTRELGRVVRRPAPWVVPAPALRLLTGELAGSLVTGQRVLPRRLLDFGYEFAHPDLRPALRQLL
jgi:uncharacterized protein (TIGR01777 family)